MELTEKSNFAVQSIMKSARQVAEKGPLDNWDRGYFRGQLAAIGNYFSADLDVLKAAEKELDAMAATPINKRG